MKKFFLVIALSALFCSVVCAKGGDEEDSREYFIYPTLGFGAIGATTGLDFMYRAPNGFALFCNLNLSIPLTPMAGIVVHPELYIGYSLKHNNLYVSFVGGIWGGMGVAYYGYELSRDVHGKVHARANGYEEFLALFGVRNDYMYFFKEKVGINFSHTHGFGAHYGRWVLEDIINYYSFLIKMSVAFKI